MEQGSHEFMFMDIVAMVYMFKDIMAKSHIH